MPKNFDRVAPVYPLLERLSFGNELCRARRAFLADNGRATNILLVGEGNGRFLRECLQFNSTVRITVVDLSARMLASARRAAADTASPAVDFIEADFLTWAGPSASYDRIYTHFFLDLFRPPSQQIVIENIGRLANPEGLWIDVDYRCPRVGRVAQWIDWLQYRFDHAFCGVEADRHYDPQAQISAAGWCMTEELLFAGGNVASRTYKRSF